ncbi:hypothetical protein MGN70_008245 [Eutypa lata]|nr:hypothetical protein MGN70_008245 [Eutypa lata]
MGTYLGEFIGFVRDDTIYRNREEHVTNIYPRGWQNPYPSTGETVLEAYWRTLHLDKLPSNLAGKLGPRYMSGRRLLRLLRGTMAAAPILMAASTYPIYHLRLFQLRMTRTEERGLIGLALVATRLGDQIFLFNGSRVSLVMSLTTNAN